MDRGKEAIRRQCAGAKISAAIAATRYGTNLSLTGGTLRNSINFMACCCLKHSLMCAKLHAAEQCFYLGHSVGRSLR